MGAALCGGVREEGHSERRPEALPLGILAIDVSCTNLYRCQEGGSRLCVAGCLGLISPSTGHSMTSFYFFWGGGQLCTPLGWLGLATPSSFTPFIPVSVHYRCSPYGPRPRGLSHGLLRPQVWNPRHLGGPGCLLLPATPGAMGGWGCVKGCRLGLHVQRQPGDTLHWAVAVVSRRSKRQGVVPDSHIALPIWCCSKITSPCSSWRCPMATSCRTPRRPWVESWSCARWESV